MKQKTKLNSISINEYKQQLGSLKDKSINKKNFADKARYFGYIVEEEVKVCEDRKYRADWKVSIGNKHVLIEYEGINSAKSRHTNIKGYTNDCEKYNLAQIHGYMVLRYTTINFCDVFKDLERIFLGQKIINNYL